MSIYKICSMNSDKVFIGFTVLPLKDQFNMHVDNYAKYLKHKQIYDESYKIFLCGQPYYELIENVSEDHDEKRKHYINTMDAVNNTIDLRKIKKRKTTNPNELLYMKNYYMKNKDKMKQQITIANKNKKMDEILMKLNNGFYKRIPKKSLEKWNVIYDEQKKIFLKA